MAFDDRFGSFPPRSQPRRTANGIRASAQRGRFGEKWWAKRWIDVLEGFELQTRLQRGRNYARQGQVISIEIGKGRVDAKVQGSRSEPYRIRIEIRTLKPSDWQALATQLSRQALHVARLLAGEMPADIEDVFRSVGLSLFPASLNEIKTHCTCPDWSNPCKHVAAVFYLLGEAFDRDPFLLFRIRGMDRDELTANLAGDASGNVQAPEAEIEPAAEPLPKGAAEFWLAKPLPENLFGEAETPAHSSSLPRRLGNLQFWRSDKPLPEALEPTYEKAARRAQELLDRDDS